jgi:hypothetical protein
MCRLCRNGTAKGSKDIWKMRKWYWINRDESIFKRGCQFVEDEWVAILNAINNDHNENTSVIVKNALIK